MSDNIFILSWDCYGLEACVDVTKHIERGNQIEKEKIFELIKDPDSNPPNKAVSEVNRIYFQLSMRARANPQRNYEIYSVHTTADITAEDLERMFKDNPQATAELIRERGTKLYSDRETSKRVIS